MNDAVIGDLKQNKIATGLYWLEHAPMVEPPPSDVAGWSGDIQVCAKCAWRITSRGLHVTALAKNVVWKPDTVACDLCAARNKGN